MPFPSRRQFLAGAAVAPLAGCVGLPAVSKVDPSAVAEANNAFGGELFAKLGADPGNVFFSPFGIEAALSMTCAGAKGNTLVEMQRVLHLAADAGNIHSGFRSLFAALNGDGVLAPKRGYELAIANALWGKSGVPWRREFLAVASKHYGAGLIEVDFDRADSAAKTINRWVEKKTRDRIKDLVAAADFSSDTRLVLTNAIYFKGSWDTAFLKERTEIEPFHRLDGSQKKVPLMHRINEFAYTENNAYQAIDIPYKGMDVSMLVWLPRKTEAFAGFEKTLSGAMIAATVKALQPGTKVALALPKFRVETSYGLKAPLAALGMKDAFGARADFSGMHTSKEVLQIDAVLHKAFVEVNEEGTEAAAATAVNVGLAMLAAPQPRIEHKVFRADRPFAFAIRHVPSNAVLFLGRIADIGT